MLTNKNIVCPENLLNIAKGKGPVKAVIVNAVKKVAIESAKQAVEANLITPLFVGDKSIIEKISKEIILQDINVEDKSFLHKDHKNNSPNKFHIKISIISDELKPKKKIDTTKRIYKILENELKNHIHSIQLSIN